MTAIESFMHRALVTAYPAETVAAVARRMSEAGVGAVVVMVGEDLTGIFTERDLLDRVVAQGKDPAGVQVGDVATRDVASVTADTSLRECAEQLRSRGVRHLPVVRDGQPIGIISARDFFEAAAGEFEKLISSAEYGKQLRRDVDPYDHFGGAYGR